MTEGMAEIEQRSFASFPFVAHYDTGLHAASVGDQVDNGLLGSIQGVCGILFQPVEIGGVTQRTVFRHFAVAGSQFAFWQCCKRIRICNHDPRLMKGSDQVFAFFGINGRFSSDRGIHLRQKSRRNLSKINSALQDGGGKADEVSDYAAAEGHDQSAAIDPGIQQSAAKLLQAGETFAFLSRNQDNGTGIYT